MPRRGHATARGWSTENEQSLHSLAAGFPDDRDRPFAWLHGGVILSYADVEMASARYANALGELGVAVGDRVAVQAEKSIEMLMLYLGCGRAGAVFLPLNPAYTIGELDYFIGDVRPT